MSNEQKIAAVHQYVEAFEKGDMAIIRALYAADAVLEDPVGTEPLSGIEAICGFYQQGFDMQVKLTLKGALRCAGNAVAFPFMVQAPGMNIEVIDVFEFNNEGKVSSMKAYWGAENQV